MTSTFSPWEIPLEQYIDLDRYPIHDLQSPIRQLLIDNCREELAVDGCSLISGFLRKYATDKMAEEAIQLLPHNYHAEDHHNPYFTADDGSYDASHPMGFFQKRTSGYITSDFMGNDSVLRQIYDSDVVLHFISDCINQGPLYRWADPIARSPYGIMENDNYFPWHFDSNEFTVTMLAQDSEAGGVFEYKPNVRSPGRENFGEVMDALQQRGEGVRQLRLKTGDMQLFMGRFSLHRVTEVKGDKARIVAIPAYVKDPYKIASPYHCDCLYGRHLPIHEQRESQHNDDLVG